MTAQSSKRTVVSVTGPVTGMAIACDSGAAWVTQCCDPVDYVLTAGTDFATPRDGKIVVQVLGSGNVSIRLHGRTSNERHYGLSADRWRSWGGSLLRWARRLGRSQR